MEIESRGQWLGDDKMFWAEDAYEKISQAEGLRRMSYFQPLKPHAEWALCLQPGDKVLTNWSHRLPEYASELPWKITDPEEYAEVTIRRTWRDRFCGSGVLVSLEELPDESGCELDSYWIKPIEAN